MLRDEDAYSDVVLEAQELVELAFYGDIDFIPTEEYSADDGRRAYDEAAWVLDLAARVIGGLSDKSTRTTSPHDS